MKKKSYRQGRLSEEIKRIVSELLRRDIKDPRLSGLVSIADVSVTADGSYATLYITVFGTAAEQNASDEEKQEVLAAFKSAKGFIRKEIGSQLMLRHTPDLLFKIDESQEYGRHIEKIIDELGIHGEDETENDEEEQ